MSIILTLFIFFGGTSFLFSQVQKKKPDEIIKVPLHKQMGVIEGIVTDDEYSALPGVTVEATSSATIEKSSTKTDEEGRFQLLNLPLGAYEVTFSLPGFKTVKRKGIIDQSGSTFDYIVTMELATTEEHVTTLVVSPIIEKWATWEYVTTMETTLSKADKDITRKIENLTISINKLQEIAERQAEGITAIKNSIKNLDVRLKKIEEKIK
jgi:hypothetical protein